MAQKRYIATVDFFIYVEENEDPKKVLDRWVEDQNRLNDSQCNILTIHDQPFGTLGAKLIYPLNK